MLYYQKIIIILKNLETYSHLSVMTTYYMEQALCGAQTHTYIKNEQTLLINSFIILLE